jgi:hypothetical protein
VVLSDAEVVRTARGGDAVRSLGMLLGRHQAPRKRISPK